MADEELELEVKKKSKLPLIIIIAVVVLLLGGGAAFFLLSGGDDATAGEEGAAAEPQVVEEVTTGDALYVAMPRPFVFNVIGGGKDRLVQIKVQLLVRGDDNEQRVKKHIPLVEGTLLRTFSGTGGDEMATLEGKELLREQALQDVRQAMTEIEGQGVIEKVLFTGFVMQ